jgi:hypothetical protein
MTAYIIGHIAPLETNYHPNCLRRYARIVRRWSDYQRDVDDDEDDDEDDEQLNKIKPTKVILGQMFGHSNVDHFFFVEKPRDSKNDLTSVMMEEEETASVFSSIGTAKSDQYISRMFKQYRRATRKGPMGPIGLVAPSVIPLYNPALRVLHYATEGNETFGTIIDYTQYYFNLAKPNHDTALRGKTRQIVNYEVEYHALEAFNMTSFTPTEFARIASHLADDESARKDFLDRFFVRTIFSL